MVTDTMRVNYVYDESTGVGELEAAVERARERFAADDSGDWDTEEYTTGAYVGVDGQVGVGGSISPRAGTDDPRTDTVPDRPHVLLRLDETELFKFPLDTQEIVDVDPGYVERVEQTVTLVRQVYEFLDPKPAVVCGLSATDVGAIWEMEEYGLPVTEESLDANRLEYVPWLVILPPPFLETYDQDALLDGPYWQTAELSDGAVLVVTHVDVRYQSDKDSAGIHEPLGLDYPLSHLD